MLCIGILARKHGGRRPPTPPPFRGRWTEFAAPLPRQTGNYVKDFWLSCGHHLLDRDEGGGLVLADEFLKVYLARPELTPPADVCVVEKTLHAALMADPRRAVSAEEIAAIA